MAVIFRVRWHRGVDDAATVSGHFAAKAFDHVQDEQVVVL